MHSGIKWLALAIVLLPLTIFAGPQQKGAPKSKQSQPSVDPALVAEGKRLAATGCDEALWQHVYHPQRLVVVQKCIAVTGTIHHVKKEADGDDHIQLKLDPGQALLNDKNKAQADSLVVEPLPRPSDPGGCGCGV